MKKFMDINPFKIGPTHSRSEGNLIKEESHFRKIRNFCLDYCFKYKFSWLLVFLIGLILSGFLVMETGFFSIFPKADSNKLQAVFLNNGLIYFGHLQEVDKENVVLKNVYYLRSDATKQNNLNLIKLGNEIYGPEDAMYFPKTQMSFWQNLKDDSQVVKLINQLEDKK